MRPDLGGVEIELSGLGGRLRNCIILKHSTDRIVFHSPRLSVSGIFLKTCTFPSGVRAKQMRDEMSVLAKSSWNAARVSALSIIS